MVKSKFLINSTVSLKFIPKNNVYELSKEDKGIITSKSGRLYTVKFLRIDDLITLDLNHFILIPNTIILQSNILPINNILLSNNLNNNFIANIESIDNSNETDDEILGDVNDYIINENGEILYSEGELFISLSNSSSMLQRISS